ncbi:MAG: BMP family ABC transporter substrate-binding protein [Candidatus Thorarchaeota archaeon]
MSSTRTVVVPIILLIVGVGIGLGAGFVVFSVPPDDGGDGGPAMQTLKAGFIYVGPIGDYGWTNAHDVGRRYIDDKYDWLNTTYLESVDEAEAGEKIDFLIENEGCDVVFTTSFGFMDATIAAGSRHPDKIFFHCSGYLRSDNVGTYFADFYQLYYLNGLMAGALTQSGQLGYVAAFPLPELIRHINAFAIGAKEVNASATVDVKWLQTDWFDPEAATTAANELVGDGVDMLAFTEDSTAVPLVANGTDGVYVFSHYSPMQSYAPTSTISGQLADWGVIYDDIIQKIYLGQYTNTNLENVDYLWLLQEGGIDLGGEFGVPINPLFEDALKAIDVTDPLLGTISVYDLVMARIAQMKNPNVVFDPYSGPMNYKNGTQWLADGERADMGTLLTIDWFVEGVIGTIPVAP